MAAGFQLLYLTIVYFVAGGIGTVGGVMLYGLLASVEPLWARADTTSPTDQEPKTRLAAPETQQPETGEPKEQNMPEGRAST